MSATTIEEHIAVLERIAAATPEAAMAAVAVAQVRIFDLATEYVPVDTGALQASIAIQAPEDDGSAITGIVSAGDDTVDYAVWVELGTGRMAGTHFMERATLEATSGMAQQMGDAFQTKIVGVV